MDARRGDLAGETRSAESPALSGTWPDVQCPGFIGIRIHLHRRIYPATARRSVWNVGDSERVRLDSLDKLLSDRGAPWQAIPDGFLKDVAEQQVVGRDRFQMSTWTHQNRLLTQLHLRQDHLNDPDIPLTTIA